MGWGTGNLGGGSAGLNFKVVGGTSQPSSPSENTIWINTNVTVSGYIFSATESEETSEGIVWISTGTQSNAEFNALKKNRINVYPVSAKQYVSGAWVDKTAKSYQNGAWVDWYAEYWIVQNGLLKYNVTKSGVNVTQKSGVVEIVGTATGGNEVYLKADLTEHKKMVAQGTFHTGNMSKLCVWNANTGDPSYDNAIAYVDLASTGATLDVSSLKGEYKIGITVLSTLSHSVTNWGLTQ